MPFIIFSIIVLFIYMFWDFVIGNIEVLGALATALAFFAGAWAAWEARSSAKAALRAVELTRESLLESKKSAFKQWYIMLLDKNSEMLPSVINHMNNSGIGSMLFQNFSIKDSYHEITKDNVLSTYVMSVYQILNFIDKEYYGAHDDVTGKMRYIEQLSNSIERNTKKVIAIFGLKHEDMQHIEYKRLSFLLKKYSFFKHDLFFRDTINQTYNLENYISWKINNAYILNHMEILLNQIRKNNYTPSPEPFEVIRTSPSLLLTLLYVYDTPAKKHIDKYFDYYPKNIYNEIKKILG